MEARTVGKSSRECCGVIGGISHCRQGAEVREPGAAWDWDDSLRRCSNALRVCDLGISVAVAVRTGNCRLRGVNKPRDGTGRPSTIPLWGHWGREKATGSMRQGRDSKRVNAPQRQPAKASRTSKRNESMASWFAVAPLVTMRMSISVYRLNAR